jgi:isopenicillin-N N-acyltransferase-like protein
MSRGLAPAFINVFEHSPIRNDIVISYQTHLWAIIPRRASLTQKKSPQKAFREVSASGSHYQIGLSIGKQCRDQALRLEKHLKDFVSSTPGMKWEKALAIARRSLPASEKYFPEYIEELEGFAEGTGIKFDVVWAMHVDFPGAGRGRGCTDIAVNAEWTKDDCVYAVHNDDVAPYNFQDISIARIKPKDEPGFIGLCYAGMEPTAGMNAAGISLTGNALVPNDTRMGIPKMLPCRKILREKGIYQALEAAMPEGRGSSFNNIVCDPNGEIYSLEGSATTFDALYADDGWLVHTNHYLSPKMWKFEENMHTRFSSIVRYNRARKLFKKELGKVEVSTFKKVLSDHVGYPESICRHPDLALGPEEQTQTILSVAFDLTNRVAWICAGNPCEGEYKKYEI